MSRADWPAYLTEFHTRRPGITELVLRRARAVDGDAYDWLAAAVPAQAAVLDLACGNAPLWTQLPGRGYLGVDLNAADLTAARARGVPCPVRADAAALPVPGASIDAVTCSMALQLLAPLPGVLAEIGRVLRPGGLLVATVPARGPLPATDLPVLAGLLATLGRRLGYPNDPQLRHLPSPLTAAGLSVVADEHRCFRYPLRDADHLDARGVNDWAAVTAQDLETFLTANTAQRIPAPRAFFAFTRRRKITLINPAADLRRSQRKGYAGPLIDPARQRQLLRRWRREDTDPRERVVGLLCLLHAASNNDVRMLTVDDIDIDRATARLRNRRHPVPLDPLTIDAIRACLQQRPTTATDNRFLLMTHHSRQHNRPCSIDFPVRALAKVGLTPQVLRQTRLSDLAQRADPRMMAEAIGITREAALHYIIGNVHRAELAFPGAGDQTRPHEVDQEQPHPSDERAR